MKKTIKKIKNSQNKLFLFYFFENEEENIYSETLNYEGLQGEFTKSEWLEDNIISSYNDNSKESILYALDNSCNFDFFSLEEVKIMYRHLTYNIVAVCEMVYINKELFSFSVFVGDIGNSDPFLYYHLSLKKEKPVDCDIALLLFPNMVKHKEIYSRW